MQTHIHTNSHPIHPENERRRESRSVRVRHSHNLAWWIVFIAAILAIIELPRFFSSEKPLPQTPERPIKNEKSFEREAFIALAFGKVSTYHELALSKTSFKAQLEALKKADYSSVRLEQVNRWEEGKIEYLPSKPVLLTFEEANSETMEIADKVLAAQGMTALVFVDVNQLNKRNITLVSWHRLEQLVNTGRWEIGVSGCLNTDEAQKNYFPEGLSRKLLQQRQQLEDRLNTHVLTANCSRSWNSDSEYDAVSAWNTILEGASLPVGFVAARFGANYHKDSKTSYRRIRVSKVWNETELLSQIKSHEPRRENFADTFQSNHLVSDWVIDSGMMSIEDDSLHMTNISGEQGAMISLGGTEKWRDAEVEVQLKEIPEGQFWISLRHGVDQPYIRLGIAGQKILLQETNGGETKQLSSRDVPLNIITLKLRVVGARVIAYLNDEILTKRPIKLASNVKQGAFAMTVWNNSNSFDNPVLNRASVNIAQVKATPIYPKNAIVAPVLAENLWIKLREQSEQITAISPRYFSWVDSKPDAFAVNNSTMEIFAHYHHLPLIPALSISADTPLTDAAALVEQAVVWASNSNYHGLNIMLKNTMTEAKWRHVLDDLDNRMHEIDKMLSITIMEDEKQLMKKDKSVPLYFVSTKTTDLLTSLPKILDPLVP